MGVCIMMAPGDNVATVLQKTVPGDSLDVLDQLKNLVSAVTSAADIPFAHKICLEPVKRGDCVRKFGAAIGVATEDIAAGEYVHIHNVVSIAGSPRGGNMRSMK